MRLQEIGYLLLDKVVELLVWRYLDLAHDCRVDVLLRELLKLTDNSVYTRVRI